MGRLDLGWKHGARPDYLHFHPLSSIFPPISPNDSRRVMVLAQYLSGPDRPDFGIFLDSSPDHWGRLLMQRREAAQARKAGKSARRLQETDYLLGVHDEQRTGALRFIERAKSDAWQCDEPWMRTPPWASLRELEHASWKSQGRIEVMLSSHMLYVANTGAPLTKDGIEAHLQSHSSPKKGNLI